MKERQEMYIADKYWDNCIGITEESISLVDYLEDKCKEEISFGEIFSDIGLDKLNGDFRQHKEPLTAVLKNVESDYDMPYVEFYFAIDIIAALAAILLECRINGSVNLCELAGYDLETTQPNNIRITATPEEYKLINSVLLDFVSEPLAYDVSEIEETEDTLETATICEKLRKELAKCDLQGETK